MFKKSKAPSNDENVNSRTVVTETVESDGGVLQTTRTTLTSSGFKGDIDSAFDDFKLDRSHVGKSIVTKKVICTTSSGQREIIEETTESYGCDVPKDVEEHKASAQKQAKPSKTLAEKLRLKPKAKKSDEEKCSANSPACMKAAKFQEDCLKSHNRYREQHAVPNLKLSKQLCEYSQEWADHLASTDSFKHRTERTYGENIFLKWSSDPAHVISGEDAVNSWYSEIKDHTFGKEPTSLKSGHFTQVIWKESKELGVAWARSSSGKILVVANYSPAGNFVGKFTVNVPPPKK